MLSSLRKQGYRNVLDIVDSRFRGNDRLYYVIVIEPLTISLGPKMVNLISIVRVQISLLGSLLCSVSGLRFAVLHLGCAIGRNDTNKRICYTQLV
jgi:hypothetical protein